MLHDDYQKMCKIKVYQDSSQEVFKCRRLWTWLLTHFIRNSFSKVTIISEPQ